MEQVSDSDDFIPPTPKNIKENASLLARSNVKISKPHKRKKITSSPTKRSPDYKKLKNKSKQVSLLNYVMKNKASDNSDICRISSPNIEIHASEKHLNQHHNTAKNNCSVNIIFDKSVLENVRQPCSVNKTVKTNLINQFKTAELQCNTSKLSLSTSLIPQVNAKIDLSHNLNAPLLSTSNKTDSQNVVSNMFNSSNSNLLTVKDCENIITNSHLEVIDTNICSEVQNLKLDSAGHETDNEVVKCRDSSSKNIACDMENSFSWMTELEWKNDTFIQDVTLLEPPVDENDFKFSSSQKSSVLFRVQDVNRSSVPYEVKLILKGQDSSLKSCYLRGFWIDSLVNVGDIVHVMSEFEKDTCVINDKSGFLVVNPDFLLSSTAIVSTLFCMRKAVLNHILPSWSSGNKVMMIGNLVHDIFQQTVNGGIGSVEEIDKNLDSVLWKQENLLALSCQNLSFSEIKEQVKEYVPNIALWIKRHVSLNKMNASENIQVTCVEGIEDNVWCPKYGIKGKIDLTVNTLFRDQKKTKILPLELKTGRPTFSAEHMGQVNLYTLMMDERMKDVSEGLLLYLKDPTNMKLVSADHNSRRGLIQLRNELAFYTYKWFSSKEYQNEDIEHCHLPTPINNKRMCQKCPYLLPCTVYQKSFLETKKLDPNHAMVSLIPSTTSHLTSSHLEYFIHWSNLLLLESTSSAVSNAFWTEDALSREKKGMCLSWMVLEKCIPINETEEKYYMNIFNRSVNSPVSEQLLNGGMRTGDYVALSNQDNSDEIAISMGYILDVNDTCIKVGTDRDLYAVPHYKTYNFRIDKQVSNSATACIRNNLMLLMSDDEQAGRLRKYIVSKENPNFLKSLPKNVVLLGRSILKVLNKIQQKAILKSLMAEDYFLIKGMPGTGKTSTIVALVRLFVKMGLSILLTSYTHSAVDNILLKLKEHIQFVRIGQGSRIHSGVKEFSFETLTKHFKTVEEFQTFMKEQMVVATTCLGINHAIFSVRKFDVCIVDEASQINQIACLGPLFHAKKFILVGDDKQLPPLVTNEKARSKGMEESLFQRLANSENSIELVIQYRMNEEIMRLCNEITYGDILQCGSENIAKSTIQLSVVESLKSQTPSWILTVMNCDLMHSVIFLNTDEIVNSSKIQRQETNEYEANIVKSIVEFLINNNIESGDIGIISPYRQQVDLIKRNVKEFRKSDIEVNTVDQYQGRDKDVIIISCVRCKESSSENKLKGSILNDERRLNVAITRARKKLIIIGCKTSLIQFKPFQNIFACLKNEQVLNLNSKDFPL